MRDKRYSQHQLWPKAGILMRVGALCVQQRSLVMFGYIIHRYLVSNTTSNHQVVIVRDSCIGGNWQNLVGKLRLPLFYQENRGLEDKLMKIRERGRERERDLMTGWMYFIYKGWSDILPFIIQLWTRLSNINFSTRNKLYTKSMTKKKYKMPKFYIQSLIQTLNNIKNTKHTRCKYYTYDIVIYKYWIRAVQLTSHLHRCDQWYYYTS